MMRTVPLRPDRPDIRDRRKRPTRVYKMNGVVRNPFQFPIGSINGHREITRCHCTTIGSLDFTPLDDGFLGDSTSNRTETLLKRFSGMPSLVAYWRTRFRRSLPMFRSSACRICTRLQIPHRLCQPLRRYLVWTPHVQQTPTRSITENSFGEIIRSYPSKRLHRDGRHSPLLIISVLRETHMPWDISCGRCSRPVRCRASRREWYLERSRLPVSRERGIVSLRLDAHCCRLVPPSVPPLRERLKLTCFTRVGRVDLTYVHGSQRIARQWISIYQGIKPFGHS